MCLWQFPIFIIVHLILTLLRVNFSLEDDFKGSCGGWSSAVSEQHAYTCLLTLGPFSHFANLPFQSTGQKILPLLQLDAGT